MKLKYLIPIWGVKYLVTECEVFNDFTAFIMAAYHSMWIMFVLANILKLIL